MTWVILPITITIVLVATNYCLESSVSEAARYVIVFLLAWAVYTGSAMSRGSKLSKETLGLNALFAFIFTFSLVGLVTALITSNAPTLVDGHLLDLNVVGTYVIVLIVLDVLAIAFTRKKG